MATLSESRRGEPGGGRGGAGQVVVGLGLTGVSCVRHLRALGLEVRAMDSRAEPPGLAALDADPRDLDATVDALVAGGARY